MKINCLSCGHNIDLDDAYADHYEGEVKCFGCNTGLEIRTEQGAVRCVRLSSRPTHEDKTLDEAQGQTAADARAKSPKAGTYKARNEAKQAAAPLSESGLRHASPADNRAA